MVSAIKRGQRRQDRVRRKIRKVSDRPRLSVFLSENHAYAQIIDDVTGTTIVSASTNEKSLREQFSNARSVDTAKKIGVIVGERAKAAGVLLVVFDKGGKKYHGRVAALATGARENLDF